MRTINHPGGGRDPLLHVETDGCVVDIEVGLSDADGHRVTRVDISPDDETRGGDGEGRIWYQDGPRIIRLEPGEKPPVVAPQSEDACGEPKPRIYLDLSTSVLPQNEMDSITVAPPPIAEHAYGAWVHVPPIELHDRDVLDPTQDADDDEWDNDWADFPHLRAVLRAARERGADWVNFDRDAQDIIPGLPTFDSHEIVATILVSEADREAVERAMTETGEPYPVLRTTHPTGMWVADGVRGAVLEAALGAGAMRIDDN